MKPITARARTRRAVLLALVAAAPARAAAHRPGHLTRAAWRAMAADGDVAKGEIRFTVGAC